jgi:hypothetical protein
MRAAWVLRSTVWHLETALEGDSHWEGDLIEEEKLTSPTVRQRTLMVLEGFAEETEQVSHLEALGGAARALAGRLRSLWQPAPCPLLLFPAFAAMGD